MEHPSASPSALSETKGDGDRCNALNAKAEAMKQRRKVQNRKNQRAHRLRTRDHVSGSAQTSRPFQVTRWRVDELDDPSFSWASSASRGTITTVNGTETYRSHGSEPMLTQARTYALQVSQPQESQPDTPMLALTSLTTPSFRFPLSTDHLLHLVQYNVFRAFVSNKRTLNTLLTGWTDNMKPPSSTTCPISGPYRDDTSVYPLNPNIPPALAPTRLQQTHLHSYWINLFPFPRVRDNLIMRDGNFDHWELLQDLIGELMSATPSRERRGTPLSITVSDPQPKSLRTVAAGHDEDEVTAGRKGLIIWGEPHDTSSWEVTPGFLAKWPWAMEGCDDLIESSNRWRLMRGEEPMRPFRWKSYSIEQGSKHKREDRLANGPCGCSLE